MALEVTNRIRFTAAASTTVFFVVEWLWFELIRIPYRPPEDMLTLLGVEKYAVMAGMATFAVGWLCVAACWLICLRFTTHDYVLYAVLVLILTVCFSLLALFPPWIVTPLEWILR